jgi:ketosteroid isomerase-like protein
VPESSTPRGAVPSTREVVERFLAAALDPGGRALADLYGDPVVLEMPFAPPGFPKRTETGNAELRARFADGAALRGYEKIDSVVIHETADPEVAVVEYRVHGRRVSDGEPFMLPYVNVMTIRDGVIVHSRDHTDPINALRALGMLPRLLDALTAELSQGPATD